MRSTIGKWPPRSMPNSTAEPGRPTTRIRSSPGRSMHGWARSGVRRGLAHSHGTGFGILLAARRNARSSLMMRAVLRKPVRISTCIADLLSCVLALPCHGPLRSRSITAARALTRGSPAAPVSRGRATRPSQNRRYFASSATATETRVTSPGPEGTLRARVLAGETLFGLFLDLRSPFSAEICARAGYDWLVVDLEHGAGTEAGLVGLLQSVEVGGSTARRGAPSGAAARKGLPP